MKSYVIPERLTMDPNTPLSQYEWLLL